MEENPKRTGFLRRLEKSIRKRRNKLRMKLSALRSPIEKYRSGLKAMDPGKKTIVLVTHEMSRTGAPILVLNMAQHLRKTYNVIVMTLLDGIASPHGAALKPEFKEACDVLIGPFKFYFRTESNFNILFRDLVACVPVEFAVVNSIVSSVVLKPLWENDIPSIHLIHEFACYTRPRGLFRTSAFYSSVQIFSASVVRQNALTDYPEGVRDGANVVVLPQGVCHAPSIANDPAKAAAERERIRKAFRPPGWPKETVVVLGLGTVQIRKGPDLFIACAKRVMEKQPKTPFRFVWIGHNYHPELDLNYSVYLADQIQRSGVEGILTFADEVAELETVYNESDMLFLSSRLDPLPLVSQDMLNHGKPVLCFEGATGVAEYMAEDPKTAFGVIPYLDVEEAANRICRLIDDPALRNDIGNAGRPLVESRFSIQKYLTRIGSIGEEQAARKDREKKDRALIVQSGMFRPDFFCSPTDLQTQENPVKQYMSSWRSGLKLRKPFPGFHPGIYADCNGVKDRDPLGHFIEKGKPDGPWQLEVIEGDDQPSLPSPPLRTALHLHLYYPELAGEILKRLEGAQTPIDLLISVSTPEAARDVKAAVASYARGKTDVRIVPNHGRDIGPLLTEFSESILNNYDIIGHIHSKKSVDIGDQTFAKNWADFLYENLLGGKTRMADTILSRMASEKTLGLVFPDDPHIIGWEKNRDEAVALATRLGIADSLPERSLDFPMGTMFWARTAALEPLFKLGLKWEDYPQEPLPYDGTMLHAIERMLPTVAKSRGFRMAVTHVRGVTR